MPASTKVKLLLHGEKVTGTVIELVEASEAKPGTATPAPVQKVEDKDKPKDKAEPCVKVAPKVSYRFKDAEHTYTSGSYTCPSDDVQKGKSVDLLVDPHSPKTAMIVTSGVWSLVFDAFLLSALMALFAVVLIRIAWMMWPSETALKDLLPDPPLDDAKVLPLLPEGAGLPEGTTLQGIVASARHIEEGNYPLDLCELCAYMAALAYNDLDEAEREINKKKSPKFYKNGDPVTVKKHLADNCKHFKHVAMFRHEGTEGFGFVFLITHNPQPASAADTASVPFGRRPSRVAASSRRDHSAD